MQTSSALRAVEDPIPTPHEGEAPQVSPAWGPARRFLFRFAFVYMVLYSFPFPLYYIPYVGHDSRVVLRTAGTPSCTWVGKQVFGVDITVEPNGSGDTTYNYVQVFCLLVLAIGGGAGLELPRPAAAQLSRGSTSGCGSTSASSRGGDDRVRRLQGHPVAVPRRLCRRTA